MDIRKLLENSEHRFYYGSESELQNYSNRVMEVAELLKKNPDNVVIGNPPKTTPKVPLPAIQKDPKQGGFIPGIIETPEFTYPEEKYYVPKAIYDAAVKFNEENDKAAAKSEEANRNQKRKNLLIAFTAKNGVVMGDDPRLSDLLDPNNPRLGTVGQAIKDFGAAPKVEGEEELGVLDAAKKQKILDNVIGFKKFQNETPSFKKQSSDIIKDITKPKQLDGQTFYNSYALNRHLKDKELQSITEKAAQEISRKYWLAGDISEFASKRISDEEAKNKKLNADIHNIVNGHKTVSVRDENYKYSKLTEDEKMLYNYFVMEQTSDMKTSLAGRYLKALELDLEQRTAVDIAEDMNGIEKGLYLFGHGIGGSLESIANIGGDFGYDPTEGEMLASAIIEGEDDGFAKFVYQSISTVSEQIPALAVGFASGGAGYSAVLSANIMSKSIKEAMQNNKTLIQGVSYGAVQASMELALERMLGGIGGKFLGKGSSSIVVKALNKIDNIFTGRIPKALLKGAVVRLENGVGEFTQEFIQGITDPAIKNIIYQENNTYSLGTLNEALYQGLLGAVSGMFLGGGANAAQTTAYYETLGDSLSDSQVLDFAKEAGNIKSELYRELSEKARKGKELTAVERGMLSKETTDLVYNNATFTKETLKFMATEGSVKQISDVLFDGNTEAAEAFKAKFSDSEYVDSLMFGENEAVDAFFVEKALNPTVAETTDTEAMAEGQTVPTVEGIASEGAETVATETESATDSIAHPAPTAGKVLKMTPVSARAKNYVKDIAKRLGTNLEFVDMAAELAKRGQNIEGLVIYPEGFYDPETHTLYVGNEVSNPVEFVFKHELTHYGERSKYYAAFARAVRNSKAFKKWLDTQATFTTKDTAGKELQLHLILKERYKGVKNLTEPEAQREVIANFVADVLFKGDVETLSEILNDATPTQKNAVMRFLSDFFNWIKSKFTGSKQIVSEIADLENKFRELIGDAAVNPMPTESGITYDTAETEANESMSVAEANTDSTGAELSKGQRKYFALSKVRDAYGRLIRLFHGTDNGGFTEFDPSYSDDGTTIFTTDNRAIAESYIKSHQTGDIELNANRPKGLRWTETGRSKPKGRAGVYTVYANLKNPLVIKGRGRNWNRLTLSNSNTTNDVSISITGTKGNYEMTIKNGEFAVGETTYTAENVGQLWGYVAEAFNREAADTFRKNFETYLNGEGNNRNQRTDVMNLLSLSGEQRIGFSEAFSWDYSKGVREEYLTTRDLGAYAKENGYDGVIIKNITDSGGQTKGNPKGTIVIAFEANQIKTVSNENPTKSKDIRYSVPASEGAVNEKTTEEVGVELDEKTESVSPLSFSLASWERSDYVTNRDKASAELAEALGISNKKAKAYIDSINGIAKVIADSRIRLDYVSSKGRSSFVSNAEYGGSIDFSTLCKKRRILTGTFSAIQKALRHSALTAEEILDIRNRLKEKGLEVSCGLCYVEGSRAQMGKFSKEFIERYKKRNPEYVPDMFDVNTPEGVEQLRIDHPEVYEAYEQFWNNKGVLNPGDSVLFASQQKPKLYQMRTEYNNEILEKFKNDDNVNEKNKNGGLRLQSFSDFEIVHLIDTMQVILDMSKVGLAGQAYTKVADFALALGNTGLKINLSLIAKDVDANGNLVFDDVEGMPIDTAMRIRDMYSDNVGTILVIFNDAQLKAALADNRVDFIIPFHRSQWKKALYEKLGLPKGTKDYTYQQNERYIKPVYYTTRNGTLGKRKATNYMPNDYWKFGKSGKENAEDYLKMCAKENKRPKFYKLLVDNKDGSYSLQPDGSTDGYWKLLIDFKMYNNEGVGVPQQPVKPDFNMEESMRMLEEYKGGHQQFPVDQETVDEFVSEYREKHKMDDFTEQKAEPKSVETVYDNLSLSVPATDQAYLSAVENGDMETAQRLVDEAAKEAGYPTKVYHGTNAFGFSSVDVKKSDDKLSFFATESLNTASTYTDNPNVKSVKEGLSPIDYDADDAIISEASKFVEFCKKKFGNRSKINFQTFYDALEDVYFKRLEQGDASDVVIADFVEYCNQYLPKTASAEAIKQFGSYVQKMSDHLKYMDKKLAAGIYALYANTERFLEVDCKGKNWDKIPEQQIKDALLDIIGDDSALEEWIRVDGKLDTRSVVKIAKRAGLNGVKFINIVDNGVARPNAGASTVYAFFYPKSQVKSADPVTYDDNSNVIPLSERFNPENNDIRFSVPASEGIIPNGTKVEAKDRGNVGTVVGYNEATGNYAVRFVSRSGTSATVTLSPNMITPVFKSDANKTKKSETNSLGKSRITPQSLFDKVQKGEITYEEFVKLVNEGWSEAGKTYGVKPDGEMVTANNKPANVPNKVAPNKTVRRFVRNVLEANYSKDFNNALKSETLAKNKGTVYEPQSNAKRVAEARKNLAKRNAESATRQWLQSKESSNPQRIVEGEALLVIAEQEGRIQDALDLTCELAMMFTDAAQKLQAATILKRLGSIGKLYYLQRTVNMLNQRIAKIYKNAPELSINETLAAQLLETKTDDEADLVINAITADLGQQMPANWLDKWNAWRYISMLVNPTTHIRNLAGNFLFKPAIFFGELFSATIQKGVGAVKGETFEKTTTFKANKRDKEFAKKDWEKNRKKVMSSGKYEDVSEIEDNRRIYKNGILEGIRKGNSNLLEWEDGIFLKNHYIRTLARYLTANKINPETASEAQLRRARDYARKKAQEYTYRDASKFASWMSRSAREHTVVGLFFDGIIPFKKTPINVFRRGIEYSPLGFIKSLTTDLAKLKKGVENDGISLGEWIDGFAASLTGTGLLAFGALLSLWGVVKIDFDDEDEWFRKLSGEQEFSIQVGDFSYTVDWAAPSSMPFFMGATYAQVQSDENTHWFDNLLDSAMSGLNPMVELSMLQGVNDLLESLSYGGDDYVPNFVGTSLTSYFSQGLPTVGGKLANLIDDTRRTKYIEKNGSNTLQNMYDIIAKKVPFLSKTRAEYIDAWGREQYTGNVIERFFAQFVSPGYASTIDPDPIYDELKAIKESTGEAGVYPEAPKKEITFGGVKRHLSKEEYYNVATMSGQTKMNLVNEAMDHTYYDKLTDEQKAEVIMNIYKYSNSLAITSELDFTLDEVKAGLGDKKGSVLTESRWNGFSFEQQQYLIHEAFMDGVITAYKYEQNGGSAAEYFILKALKNN